VVGRTMMMRRRMELPVVGELPLEGEGEGKGG